VDSGGAHHQRYAQKQTLRLPQALVICATACHPSARSASLPTLHRSDELRRALGSNSCQRREFGHTQFVHENTVGETQCAASASMASSPTLMERPLSTSQRRQSMASLRDDWNCKIPPNLTLSIVVLGASGDLAKKKTFPALFALFKQG
jgi:Glucose-6-phosphate dehydrogenase, NAD binding domain